jgi:excisionase family DNA binding protein
MLNLLDSKEAAKEMKISIHTLRAWTYQKRLPVVKLGRKSLFRREDIENFVSRSTVQAKDGK